MKKYKSYKSLSDENVRIYNEIPNLHFSNYTGEVSQEYKISDLKSIIKNVINLVDELEDAKGEYDKSTYRCSTKERALGILEGILSKIEK